MENTTIAAVLGAVILASGGTYALTQEQIDILNAELEQRQIEKSIVLRDYVYAKAQLDQLPAIDLSYVSTEELSQAYIDAAETNDVTLQVGDNAFTKLRDDAFAEHNACTEFSIKKLTPVANDPYEIR